MELYDWLLFVHILSGITWFGGVIYNHGLTASAGRRGPAALVDAYVGTSRVNNRLFPAAMILIIATAIWMIIEDPVWDWDQTWINVALGLFVLSFITGAAFFGREDRAIPALVAARGNEDEAVLARVRRALMVGRIETVGILVILLMMVWKPGA